MAVMAGRVVPMFTNNGVRGAQATRHPLVEKLALGSLLALLVADLLPLPGALLAALAALACAAHLARWWLWQPWTTWRTPLVWVLHAAYLLDSRAPGAARGRGAGHGAAARSPRTR